MVNYYELLSIPMDANRASIEQAIKKTRRLWNNRANNPDASIRAEAEKHVKEIAEAEKILLNEAKREEYNQQLMQNPRDSVGDQSPDVSTDWEEEYFQAYNRDMNDYAAQIAQRAINVNERDGRAWYLYGEALRRSGNTKQAIAALQRATMYLADSDGVYRQLGFAFMSENYYGDALKAFGMASQLAPDDVEYYTLRANCFRAIGMISEALTEAEKAYRMNSNDNNVRFEYFVALHEDAMASMSYNRSSGKHLIINRVQLDYINNLLKKMALTIPEDSNKAKCTAAMEEIVQIVVDAESIKGGGFFKAGKPGYEYNYEISNSDTRSTGRH